MKLFIALIFGIVLHTASGSAFSQATQPSDKPRIGVVVSKYNSEAKLEREPTGYNRMVRVLKEFRDGDFDIVPIIDHGTLNDPDVANVCSVGFPGAKPIDFTDADALSKLDVIVASHLLQMDKESFAALETSVKNGTGLYIRMFFGLREPGINDPVVAALNGIEPGTIKYLRDADIEAQASRPHPIIGSLSETMERVVFSPNGIYGKYTGTPLMELAEDAQVNAPNRNNEIIAVVYTAQYGKGSIIVSPFAGSKPVPAKLDKSGEKSFGTRCLLWLTEQKRSVLKQ